MPIAINKDAKVSCNDVLVLTITCSAGRLGLLFSLACLHLQSFNIEGKQKEMWVYSNLTADIWKNVTGTNQNPGLLPPHQNSLVERSRRSACNESVTQAQASISATTQYAGQIKVAGPHITVAYGGRLKASDDYLRRGLWWGQWLASTGRWRWALRRWLCRA